MAQVIGDALPIPSACPEPVQQLLEAALAHHNLGRYSILYAWWQPASRWDSFLLTSETCRSFEEALKFLEAASIQLTDIEFRARDSRKAETGNAGGRGVPNFQLYILVPFSPMKTFLRSRP
jgi:hypothetical protein